MSSAETSSDGQLHCLCRPLHAGAKLARKAPCQPREARTEEKGTRQLGQREIPDSTAGAEAGAEKNGDGLLSFRHEIANLVPENLDTAIQARKRPSTFIVIISIPLLRLRPFPVLRLIP